MVVEVGKDEYVVGRNRSKAVFGVVGEGAVAVGESVAVEVVGEGVDYGILRRNRMIMNTKFRILVERIGFNRHNFIIVGF